MKLFIHLSKTHATLTLFAAVMLLVGCGAGDGDAIAALEASPQSPVDSSSTEGDSDGDATAAPDLSPLNPVDIPSIGGAGEGNGDETTAPDASPLNPVDAPSIGEANPDISVFDNSTFGTATWSR